jgi:sirohydrochlorin ferrochelatase
VLLVGHGTRSEAGRAEFLRTAAALTECLPHLAVEACFLEMAAPGIPTAVRRLAGRHVRRICVVPLMLLAARHVKHDIPAAVTEAVAEPPLRQILDSVARRPFRHVVVQPHLLFEGNLLQRVRALVAAVAANSSSAITWSVAEHLGASPLLTQAASSIVANQLSDHAEE